MSSEELELVMDDAESQMKKAINHLEAELIKIRAGKANPSMVDGITVDYYGAHMPINQVANINVLDARTLSIQPWEKNMIQPIEKAILQANIGITPQNDGMQIRLFMPPLTEERRRELFKKASGEGEHCRVAIRNIRNMSKITLRPPFLRILRILRMRGSLEDGSPVDHSVHPSVKRGFTR